MNIRFLLGPGHFHPAFMEEDAETVRLPFQTKIKASTGTVIYRVVLILRLYLALHGFLLWRTFYIRPRLG